MSAVDVRHLRAGQKVRVTHEGHGHRAVTEGLLWAHNSGYLECGVVAVRSPIGYAMSNITAVEVLADPKPDTRPGDIWQDDDGDLWLFGTADRAGIFLKDGAMASRLTDNPPYDKLGTLIFRDGKVVR